jgi:predicted permease
MRSIDLAAGGTIPVMLILLGVQLTHVEFSGNLRALQLSVSLRLLFAPLAALLFAALFGLQGFTRQGSVQASMPSMVSAMCWQQNMIWIQTCHCNCVHQLLLAR